MHPQARPSSAGSAHQLSGAALADIRAQVPARPFSHLSISPHRFLSCTQSCTQNKEPGVQEREQRDLDAAELKLARATHRRETYEHMAARLRHDKQVS